MLQRSALAKALFCSHNVHKYALEHIVLDKQAGDMVCLDKHTFGHARHAYRAVGVSHARHAYNAVQSLLLTECGHVLSMLACCFITHLIAAGINQSVDFPDIFDILKKCYGRIGR